ncbi:BA75_03944T0 [Komagataella pastoris]|uniref:BA75_03944T0 n=1 Tax=Komagataella pastoris TaxID=4922 RepID=A0A1B2JG87_PICPA|nr:BA75_03944T0 [Komagataella pastoris]
MLVTFQFKQKPQKVKKPSKTFTKTQKMEEHLLIENPDSISLKKRSRNGCVTCKVRKKRCDESKPICGDCARLKRPCKYLNDTMTPEETKRIKSEILVMEEEYKCRRRNKKRPKSSSSSNKQNKVVFNPLTPLAPEMPLSEEFNGAPLATAPQPSHVAHTDHVDSPNSLHKSHSIHDLFSQFSNQFPFSPFMMKSPNIENGEGGPLLHDLPDLHLDSEFLPTYQQEFEAEMSKDIDFSNNVDHHNDTHNNNHNVKNNSQYRPLYESSRVELLEENKNQLINSTQPHNHLEIIDNPSLIATTTLSVLNSQDIMYYDYFKRRLSRIISIVPEKENLYLKIFLPMAHYDLGCLYGILAWSSFHMGNHHQARGNVYVDKALKYINDTKINENNIEEPGNTATKWLSRHNRVNMRLASLLIICGAEICKGDVKNWGSYLEQAAMLVKRNGGLSSFNESQSQHWLIANMAYHDILTSSASERGLLFSLDEYARVVNFSKFGLDPLHGISKPLFQIIAEISSLATEVKHLLKRTTNTLTNQYLGHANSLDSPEFDYATDIPGTSSTSGSTSDESVAATEFESRHDALLYINTKANDILRRIDNCHPNMEFLRTLPPKDLNLQLSLFQVFQLAAKLHIQQSVLKNPATSLPIQLLICEMSRYLDHVLNSPVESCLCFPLFVCGMNCCTKKDRKLIRDKFDEYLDRYRYGNVERTKIIMEQVWMMNPTGSKNIDWYEIVKKLGWNLSFA